MCNISLTSFRMWSLLLTYLVAHARAYPVEGWNTYPQAPREYLDDDYYYAPKVQYYYDSPAIPAPEVYGQIPYSYYYDPYTHLANEAPKRQEERLAALPIGQETWFESEAAPRWRSTDVDDVNAAFLDNLILTQMAQDAQRRRENARAAFPPVDYGARNAEDEDVRELKALAGKPLYHGPKTVPKIEDYDEEDYPNDEGFINWNGNKRSLATVAPVLTTASPALGQKEIVVPRPAQKHDHGRGNKRSSAFYKKIAKLLEESTNKQDQKSMPSRRIEKRFVAGDSDLVMELRGLKHRIAT